MTEDRHVAPGGTARMIIGFAIGLLAGALLALLLPRDDGPRRGSLVYDDLVPDADAPPLDRHRGEPTEQGSDV